MAIATTAAILGSIGAGGNLLGGILGKRAAKSAAELQAEAAAKAAQQLKETTEKVNPQILEAAKRAGLSATEAAKVAATKVNESTTSANKLLDPYRTTGDRATELLSADLDKTGKAPTLEELQMDPGYAFRTAESEKAILSRAAALGGATGGGVLKALTKYRGAEASQEYQNAFERFRTTNADRFNRLFAVSQQGKDAAVTSGGNLINAGKYEGDTGLSSTEYAGDKDYGATVEAGRNTLDTSRSVADLETQAANARAAGKVGGANALMGGITGAADSVTSAAILSKLLKNPAAKYRTLRPPVGLDLGAAA